MRLSLETTMSTRLRQTMSVSCTAMITMLPLLSVRMVSGLVTLSGASGAMRNHRHLVGEEEPFRLLLPFFRLLLFRSENRGELNPFSLCTIFIFYTSSLISIVCIYVTSLTSLTSIVRTYVTWPGSLI